MIEFLGKTKIDFMGLKLYTLFFSAALVLLGAFSLIQIGRGMANLGIDFTGGVTLQLKFSKPVPVEEARSALTKHGLAEADLQEFPAEAKLLVRVKKKTALEERAAGRITETFTQEFPDNSFTVESVSEIGPTIGQKLKIDALKAISIALVMTLLYIAVRFQFRFGVAATIATFHDVLIVLGILFLLNKEMNLLIVSALLTIAGYSLTDTVVVFDRIREKLKTRHRDPLEQTINQAINEVLSRTIITSLTTFLACLGLFFLGGAVIHDFSLTLLIGVIVGTYSSIFVASPLVLVWEGQWRTRGRAPASQARPKQAAD